MTDTKTDTLARLRELAMKAQATLTDDPPSEEQYAYWDASSPQTILRLLDVIAAADKMRHMGSMHGTFNTIDLDAYDTARAVLDKP